MDHFQQHIPLPPAAGAEYLGPLLEPVDFNPSQDIDDMLDNGGHFVINGMQDAEILLNRFCTYLQDIKSELDDVKKQLSEEKKEYTSKTKTEVKKILSVIDDNSEKLTTQEYLNAMNSLNVLYNL